MSRQLHAPAALPPPPRERAPGTHWTWGWVGPRAGLDEVEKRKFLNLPGLELRLRGRPARSQSLYRLRYPGSFCNDDILEIIQILHLWVMGILTTILLRIHPRWQYFSVRLLETAEYSTMPPVARLHSAEY
jgi:hypothetical protein